MLPYHASGVFVLAAMTSSAVFSMEFAMLPDKFDLTESMQSTTTVTAASEQECVDSVAAADATALAISYDSAGGGCAYSSSIYGYKLRSGGQQPVFYLRTDKVMKDQSETDCITTQDAEYLIAMLTFGDEQCVTPSSYDSATGLCAFTSLVDNAGSYGAGRVQQYQFPDIYQNLWYTLSRDKAMEASNYECSAENHPKMIFDGTWYCYWGIEGGPPSSAKVKDNACQASLGSGWAPVKISDAREYGYLYDWRTPAVVYLGLYLQDAGGYGEYAEYGNGPTAYWYDSSEATGLPWASGLPGQSSYDLVYIKSDLNVADGDGSDANGFPCKALAAEVGYDPTAKFL